MEWYLRSNMDDFVVPKDQEVYERLPSPGSWSKWGMGTPEDFMMDPEWNDKEPSCDGQISCSEVDMGCYSNLKDQSSGSSIDGRSSEESRQQSGLMYDQLDSLAGIEQMDELFLYKLNLWDYDS